MRISDWSSDVCSSDLTVQTTFRWFCPHRGLFHHLPPNIADRFHPVQMLGVDSVADAAAVIWAEALRQAVESFLDSGVAAVGAFRVVAVDLGPEHAGFSFPPCRSQAVCCGHQVQYPF